MPQSSRSMPASRASGDEKRESRMLRRSRARGARMLAHRLLLVRPGGDHGGALALDELERGGGLEDLLQQQAGARGERRAERHRDARRPEERLRGEDAVVGCAAPSARRSASSGSPRALQVQHALRVRGRAGGVDQHAVVATARPRRSRRRAARRARRRRSRPAPATTRRRPRDQLGPRHDDAAELRQRRAAEAPGRAVLAARDVVEELVEEVAAAQRALQQQHRDVGVAQEVVALGRASRTC